MQSIDLHVQQVNEDRYASLGIFIAATLRHASDIDMFLGTFLLHNYKQAQSIILNLGRELQIFEASTNFRVGAADFLRWHEEEMAFLSTAKRKEPDEVTLKFSYVEAMEKVFSIE
jgi:hypothetical protein